MKLGLIYEEFTRAFLSDKGYTRKYVPMRFIYSKPDLLHIAFMINGESAYVVDISDFPFDYGRFGRLSEDFDKKVLDVPYNSVEVKFVYTITKDKEKYAKFKAESGEIVYIKEKLLKVFDDNCTFYIDKEHPHTSPVAVYEYKTFVGMVVSTLI